MTTHPMDHSEFLRRVEAYLAGGLDDPAERQAFEAHAALCAACAATLAEIRDRDAALRELFAGVRPDVDFEDRLVTRLRTAHHRPRRPRLHPMARRAITGVAAAILLGAMGLVGEVLINNRPLPFAARGVVGAQMSLSEAKPDQRNHRASEPTEYKLSQEALVEGDARNNVAGKSDETGVTILSRQLRTSNRELDALREPVSPETLAYQFNESAVRGLELSESAGTRVATGDSFMVERSERLGEAAPGKDHRALEERGEKLKQLEKGRQAQQGGQQGPQQSTGEQTGSQSGKRLSGFGRSGNGREERERVGAVSESLDRTAKPPAATNAPADGADREKVAQNNLVPSMRDNIYQYGARVQPGQKAGGDTNTANGIANRYFRATDRPGISSATDEKDLILLPTDGVKESEMGPGEGQKGQNGQVKNNRSRDVRLGTATEPDFEQSPDFNLQATNGEGQGLFGVAADLESAGAAGDGDDDRGDRSPAKTLKSANGHREQLDRAFKDALDKAQQKQIPEEDILRYPSDWPEVSVLSKSGQGGASEQEVTLNVAPPNQEAVQPNPPAADAGADAAPQQQPQQPPPPVEAQAGQKIIRNGEMTFEVDGFDSALLTVTKIAREEGGYVSTTESNKLPNGKVSGTVILRVPPGRLDTLVLKLRGLGDLKTSRIAAQDITKQYTDLESQLKAARAMEARLQEIIKSGKGAIKELLEAEKQRGVWQEKIERLQGEINFYNNLVSLSTLTLTITERDIRQAGLLTETEQVSMGVEAEDVEKARAAALAAIDQAKGRIVQSELKRHDAGQFSAEIVAEVAPDAAGPLTDRLKQIGRVSRLEIERKQSTPEGTAPLPGAKVERQATRLLISLYNLANIEPREKTSLNIAAPDVEKAYRAVLDQVKSAGGRVVTSQLNRPRPDQTTGTVTFESPTEQADVLLGAVRAVGEVMRLDVNQNPDTQNTTDAKRGFSVQIFSLAAVAPRETTTLRIATRRVPESFNTLRDAVQGAESGRLLTSQIAEQDGSGAVVTANLDFEVRREDWPAVEAGLAESGQIVSRQVNRSSDTENTVDTKIRLTVTFIDETQLNPRETVSTQLGVTDVPGVYGKLLEVLRAADARILSSELNQAERDNVTGSLSFDLRAPQRAAVEQALAKAGDVVSRSVTRSSDTSANTLDDKIRYSVTITDADRLPPRETTTLGMEVDDVDRAVNNVRDTAVALGGRTVDATLAKEKSGRVIGKLVVDVPLNKGLEILTKARDQGRVQVRRDSRDERVPEGQLTRLRLDVTFANEAPIVEAEDSLAGTFKGGLRTSAAGLLWSLRLIVIGLFLVLPWALILWAVWRVVRGRRRRAAEPVVPSGPTGPTPAPV